MPPKKKASDGPQKNSDNEMEDRLTRIAIVSADRCRPKKCRQECKKACPVVKVGTPTLLSCCCTSTLYAGLVRGRCSSTVQHDTERDIHRRWRCGECRVQLPACSVELSAAHTRVSGLCEN
jgi:hypothetical protein